MVLCIVIVRSQSENDLDGSPLAPASESAEQEPAAKPGPFFVPGGAVSRFGKDNIYRMTPSQWLPLTLSLNASQDALAQVRLVLTATPRYDDPKLFQPFQTQKFVCEFHAPQQWYGDNPTQFFVGLSEAVLSISNTPGKVRLTDKLFGMFLAYAMDEYGLNPSMLLGLSSKESFATYVQPELANRLFLSGASGDEVYNCYADGHVGYCSDANGDGPFQVETGAAASDASWFAQRFFTGDQKKVLPQDRKPRYVDDNTYLSEDYQKFKDTFHDLYTKDFHHAVVLTALDFHARFNALLLIPGLGMRTAFDQRPTYAQKEDLLFASEMFAYNRGLYGDLPDKLSKCGPNADPIADCGLDGFAHHSGFIKEACAALQTAGKVYDFPITRANVGDFVNTLHWTFPYPSVDTLAPNPIDWARIERDSGHVFDFLATRRKAVSGWDGSSISFRYDWRLLLSVIRAHLPQKEHLVGPSVEIIASTHNGVAQDPPPFQNWATSPKKGILAPAGERRV